MTPPAPADPKSPDHPATSSHTAALSSRRAWRRPRPSPLGAALLPALGLTLALVFGGAVAVVWLSGRPWANGWGLNSQDLPWKDRLTLAAAVVTGISAVVAVVISYRKQRDAEEGRFATLFADAAAQLGNASPAVRMAGAYALAALADRTPERRQECIDALCAYLRLPYDSQAGAGHVTASTVAAPTEPVEHATVVTTTESYRPEDREVRLTIIRIIRDHLRDPASPTTWCGRDLDFTGATFDGGNFDDAVFTDGQVSFDRAVFAGGQVSFEGARFTDGQVSFDDAVFTDGRVSFDRAVFAGGRVSFEGARFTDGQVSFEGAKLNGGLVSFAEARFEGGTVSFDWALFASGEVYLAEARFEGGTVSFDWVSFEGGTVYLNRAWFAGGTVTFTGARIGGRQVSFKNAYFSSGEVSFKSTVFVGGEVSFKSTVFVGGEVSFEEAEFEGGTVFFDDAEFTDGQVTFDRARFEGGQVTRDGQEFRGWSPRLRSPATSSDQAVRDRTFPCGYGWHSWVSAWCRRGRH